MNDPDIAAELTPSGSPDSTESTVQFYEVHAKEYFEHTLLADLSSIYDDFSKLLKGGARVLDAGCGSGRDLKNLRARGFNAVGIDASGALVELARQYSGAECFKIRLEDVSFNASFDGVWACASLLHVPKSKIAVVVTRLRKSLVGEGILFASVQLGEGETVAADGRYFAYYQKDEFADCLRSAGFIIDRSWISGDTLPSQRPFHWLNVLAHNSLKK